MNDDGHSPETCNYNECKADSEEKCPFMREFGEVSRSASPKPVEDHAHRYTVPVEWEYSDAHWERFVDQDGKTLDERQTDKATKRVTKLRCETCPNEVER